MTSFDELDDYLGAEMSLSYWSDEGIETAARLIAAFGPADWAALTAAWRERPLAWQLRCAETLEYSDLKRGIPLLLEMLVHDDDEVAQQAAYTLNMRRLQTAEIDAGPEVRARLQRLAQERPGDAETNQALLGRIHFLK